VDPTPLDDLLAEARDQLDRVAPQDLPALMATGAVVVDIRPVEQRHRDGELAGALVVDRNVLEWRLAPSSPDRIIDIDDETVVVIVCNEGYSSSLAAATLQRLGIRRATDLDGGYQALIAQEAVGDRPPTGQGDGED
jgi:rhodanese-related sulfurtransferase